MLQRFLSLFLIVLLLVCAARAEKSKKAYELIYQDVQILKQQILQLTEKIKANTEDIESIKKQLGEILTQLRLFQREQASIKEELKAVPTQYQILLEKLEEMSLQLIKIVEELLVLKSTSLPPPSPQEENLEEEQTPSEAQTAEEQAKEPTEEKTLPPAISLSPQEVYNMAYSDYLKGNFQLAIDGFKIYKEQFSESPLADNAQYWIGECYFSQGKFEEAIEEFNNSILNYPHGDKISAAYLKKGLSLLELGKKEEALSVFKLLISKYPLSEETKLAQQKIKELVEENERY
jgi:tol-pal system protein YbgF